MSGLFPWGPKDGRRKPIVANTALNQRQLLRLKVRPLRTNSEVGADDFDTQVVTRLVKGQFFGAEAQDVAPAKVGLKSRNNGIVISGWRRKPRARRRADEAVKIGRIATAESAGIFDSVDSRIGTLGFVDGLGKGVGAAGIEAVGEDQYRLGAVKRA